MVSLSIRSKEKRLSTDPILKSREMQVGKIWEYESTKEEMSYIDLNFYNRVLKVENWLLKLDKCKNNLKTIK